MFDEILKEQEVENSDIKEKFILKLHKTLSNSLSIIFNLLSIQIFLELRDALNKKTKNILDDTFSRRYREHLKKSDEEIEEIRKKCEDSEIILKKITFY